MLKTPVSVSDVPAEVLRKRVEKKFHDYLPDNCGHLLDECTQTFGLFQYSKLTSPQAQIYVVITTYQRMSCSGNGRQ